MNQKSTHIIKKIIIKLTLIIIRLKISLRVLVMTNSKYKEGHVKQVDKKSLEIKILGPKNEKGYYREKVISLHSVQPFEESKEEAFEFMRSKLVGKKVHFQSFKMTNNKSAADVFLNKELFSHAFVSQGFGKPVESG